MTLVNTDARAASPVGSSVSNNSLAGFGTCAATSLSRSFASDLSPTEMYTSTRNRTEVNTAEMIRNNMTDHLDLYVYNPADEEYADHHEARCNLHPFLAGWVFKQDLPITRVDQVHSEESCYRQQAKNPSSEASLGSSHSHLAFHSETLSQQMRGLIEDLHQVSARFLLH